MGEDNIKMHVMEIERQLKCGLIQWAQNTAQWRDKLVTKRRVA